MSQTSRRKPSGVRLDLISDEKVFYNDNGEEKLVGQHARNANGEYVYVMWQTLLRMESSFAMTTDVFEQVSDDVRYIYVIDKQTKDLYKFDYATYRDAETRTYNNQKQLIPPRWEFINFWESCADNCLRGVYE